MNTYQLLDAHAITWLHGWPYANYKNDKGDYKYHQ